MTDNNHDLTGKPVTAQSKYIDIICEALQLTPEQIHDVRPLASGMTNHSFLFSCGEDQYIFRTPGEGTNKLINRQNEYRVYQQIIGKGICDDIVYFDADAGYKITKFIPHSHNCNPFDESDVTQCIAFLKQFHQRKLSVAHYFDIFKMIGYYESLMDTSPPRFVDYQTTKQRVFSLANYIDAQPKDICLTHIDAVPDNFIITDERIYLIDWEYAAMQDPHVDIAMFAIYSLYDRAQIEKLIDLYFDGNCPKNTRLKIYCYIAMCGLLWSNWCEYKAKLGIDFGDYAERQYQYAKEYYQIFMQERSKHRVESAIIVAAGKGERMRPITDSLPKPLIKIFGKPIIENTIEILLEKGIKNIYIVVGYLAEQFSYLAEKYGVQLILNRDYDKSNNISSLYCAKEFLKNSIILDADIWITDPDVILTEFKHSGYTSIWTSQHSEEWIQTVDEQDRLLSCSRGGTNGWILNSISYWSDEDCQQLRADMEAEYIENHNTQIYWDDIPVFCYPEHYRLQIKRALPSMFIEFDSIKELAAFDSTYQQYLK